MDLFGDPRHSIVEQSLRAYEYRDRWVNRMTLPPQDVSLSKLF